MMDFKNEDRPMKNYSRVYKNFKWQLPKYFNLTSEIDKWAEDKSKVALYWEDDEGNEAKYTFWELKNYSNKLANVLKKHKIKKQEKVILLMPRLPEFHMSYLGIVKHGSIAIPVSQLFGIKALEYVINNSEAVAIVTTPEIRAKSLRRVPKNTPKIRKIITIGAKKKGDIDFWEEMDKASKYFEPAKTKGSDLSTYLYTSGTTGMPKGVMHTHWWLLGNKPQVYYWADVRENDISWCTADLTWITGLINAFLGPMSLGSSVVCHNGRFDPVRWFGIMEKYEVTKLVSAPTAYRLIMAASKDLKKKYDLKLKQMGSIGERMNEEISRWWEKRYGLAVYDGYGQTEDMAFICNYPGMKVKLGSTGKPVPGHVVTIRNQDTGMEIKKADEVGIVAMLRTCSPVLYQGYWKNRAKTASTLKGKWYYTGDRGYKDKEGYYWIMGRDDDVIKYSGYRVGPYEVESSLLEHPAVQESAVVGKPDKTFGHIIKALIILNPGYKPSKALIKDLQNYVKKDSAAYKYPREVVFVKELPKTRSGKIIRKRLREAEEKAAGIKKDKKVGL